ncbi:hypothetical protein G7046_g5201 [Stylonectria norvegica]|nr:hypothetical protein G7046_g5201 [Stylonectria norvegica]
MPPSSASPMPASTAEPTVSLPPITLPRTTKTAPTTLPTITPTVASPVTNIATTTATTAATTTALHHDEPDAPDNPDAHLPKGQCRYILMIPELKGQRCGCMSFDHNKTLPGATCHCGHLSCFHVTSPDAPSPGKNKNEIDLVKQRVQLLEDHLDRTDNDGFCGVVGRLSELEETVDRNREEATAEIKGSYRNIYAAWQLVEQLQKRMKNLEDLYHAQSQRMAKTGREVEDLRNRQLELLDSDESLEERIEKLETSELLLSPPQDPEPDGSNSDYNHLPSIVAGANQCYRRPLNPAVPAAVRCLPAPVHSRPWTIHVSLLPSNEQPFPFEKDTTAYKRCLSRGLHRMVAVEGNDAQSLDAAISRSFQPLLKDRPWMPLLAKLCDAEKLQGLPMLRPLESKLIQGQYDREFLHRHCGIADTTGKMDSLYIALVNDTLSWNFLKRSPVYLEGLETSWEHDVFLDKQDTQDKLDKNEKREGEETQEKSNSTNTNDGIVERHDPQQLTTTTTLAVPYTSLKRSVSEVSCSSGLDEADGSRKKVPRTCKAGLIEVRRGVETAR